LIRSAIVAIEKERNEPGIDGTGPTSGVVYGAVGIIGADESFFAIVIVGAALVRAHIEIITGS
jgi:hypothetical protein